MFVYCGSVFIHFIGSVGNTLFLWNKFVHLFFRLRCFRSNFSSVFFYNVHLDADKNVLKWLFVYVLHKMSLWRHDWLLELYTQLKQLWNESLKKHNLGLNGIFTTAWSIMSSYLSLQLKYMYMIFHIFILKCSYIWIGSCSFICSFSTPLWKWKF